MATNLKLASSGASPPRSPERTALADIIQRRDALMREIENAKAAHAKAREHRYDAQCCLEKARADSEAAVNIDAFISAVQSGSDIDQQLKAAGNSREDIEQLTRDFDMWSRTEEACKQRVAELERDERYFPVYAQGKIDEVIRAEVDVSALLDGFDEMWTEVNKRLSVLKYLHGRQRRATDSEREISGDFARAA